MVSTMIGTLLSTSRILRTVTTPFCWGMVIQQNQIRPSSATLSAAAKLLFSVCTFQPTAKLIAARVYRISCSSSIARW